MKVMLYELGMYTDAEIISLVNRINKDRKNYIRKSTI
jgi:hypothetical protein